MNRDTTRPVSCRAILIIACLLAACSDDRITENYDHAYEACSDDRITENYDHAYDRGYGDGYYYGYANGAAACNVGIKY